MFEIKYRIITDQSYWKTMNLEQLEKEGDMIEGFFQIDLFLADYGYYHDRELGENEEGFDLISIWLEHLLKVCLLVDETKYVAIKDIDSYNTWLEFISVDNDLLVSEVQLDINLVESIITKPIENIVYPEWKGIPVNREVFIKEVINTTKKYISDLIQINPLFVMTQTIVELQSMIEKIR